MNIDHDPSALRALLILEPVAQSTFRVDNAQQYHLHCENNEINHNAQIMQQNIILLLT